MLLWNPSAYAVALIVTAVGVAAGIALVAWQKRCLPEGGPCSSCPWLRPGRRSRTVWGSGHPA